MSMLSSEDRRLFFEVWLGLLAFVNDKHGLVKGFGHPRKSKEADVHDVVLLRDKLWEDAGIIDEYMESGLAPREHIEILNAWKTRRIAGDFLFVRQLKKYAVLMNTDGDRLYGVLGISDPLSELVAFLPVMLSTVLLPFRGAVIYDSIIYSERVSFGHNMREDINDEYQRIKAERGIITTLEGGASAGLGEGGSGGKGPVRRKKAKEGEGSGVRDEWAVKKERQRQLSEMVREFCEERLDGDYARICEKVIAKMGRMGVRKSGTTAEVPFMTGHLEIWAAGVVQAVGSVNFLFDQSFRPYIPLGEINEYFGTKQRTVENKSRQIREMFKMDSFNNEFLTERVKEDNPLNHMMDMDGVLVPISSIPWLRSIFRGRYSGGRSYVKPQPGERGAVEEKPRKKAKDAGKGETGADKGDTGEEAADEPDGGQGRLF